MALDEAVTWKDSSGIAQLVLGLFQTWGLCKDLGGAHVAVFDENKDIGMKIADVNTFGQRTT